MPGGEGKTKNNMAGRVGSGLFFFSPELGRDYLFVSRSAQGYHRGAVSEAARHEALHTALMAGCSLETT